MSSDLFSPVVNALIFIEEENPIENEQYDIIIIYPVNIEHIHHPVHSSTSFNIKSSKRNTEGDVVNNSRAVFTVQIQGVSSVKVEYKSTSSCKIFGVRDYKYTQYYLP